MLALRTPLLTLAVILIAVAYGITFPLLSTRVEATGVSGLWIGVNGAVPAAGWILGSLIVPALQIRWGVSLKMVLVLFLATAIAALGGLRFADSFEAMTLLRLFFGGAMGIFFRAVEYWIDSVSASGQRGRNVAVYSALFMLAIIGGSVAQPELGSQGWEAFAPPLLLACGGLALVSMWSGQPSAVVEIAPPPSTLRVARSMPIALLGVVAYGAYECAPTMLLQVYAMKNGIDGGNAAYVLAAAALGNILIQYPVAAVSDRIGRRVPLLLCLTTGAAAAAVLPLTLPNATAFLAVCVLLGGVAGSAYSMALAMLGDNFSGAQLVVANAAFGVAYAVASLIGPLVNGMAIEHLNTHGLMVSLALILGGAAAIVAIGMLSSAMRGRA